MCQPIGIMLGLCLGKFTQNIEVDFNFKHRNFRSNLVESATPIKSDVHFKQTFVL